MVTRGILNEAQRKDKVTERKGETNRQGKRQRERKGEGRKGYRNSPNSLMKAGGCRSSFEWEHGDHTGHWATRRRLRQIITYFMTFLHRPFNLPTREGRKESRGRARYDPRREIRKWNHTLITSTFGILSLYASCLLGGWVSPRQFVFASESLRVAHISTNKLLLSN